MAHLLRILDLMLLLSLSFFPVFAADIGAETAHLLLGGLVLDLAVFLNFVWFEVTCTLALGRR